jgi:two-component system NtrC family sensor kinase
MFRRSRVAWKLSGLFSALIVLVWAVTAYMNSLDDRREALASARDVSRVDSRTLILSLHRFMGSRDLDGIRELVQGLAQDNPVYHDIQLAAHEGEIVVSFRGPAEQRLDRTTWPCLGCHEPDRDKARRDIASLDRVWQTENGRNILSVVTPIQNEADCSNSGCHVHEGVARPLGYLKVDYSLQRVDALVAEHRTKTAIGVLIAVLLCTLASWWVVQRLVGRRVGALVEGLRRVTNADFDFRFREDGNDEFAELASSFNEMTAQLSGTLRQLKRTREYMEGIVENSADIIITVDPEGLIRTFNAGAEKTLGYGRDEVIGKHVEMLFADPSERDVAIARLEYTDHVVNYETHFVTKTGKVRDVILTLSRLRRADGTPIGTYGISKDVTREKRLQRQLLQSEKMAALGQAITGIQHSVKNLLNVLKGGSYIVKTGLAKGDKQLLSEGWEMVEEGIAHMTQLSTTMLQFARERRLDLQETDLAELARGIHGLSNARFRDKGVEFVVDIDDELPRIRCDRELIHSVLMDLLSNALDACEWRAYGPEEKAQVELSVRRWNERSVCIAVSDNGEGMTEEIKANLFTPFFSTKKGAGTGMGLSVVARAVSSHGGKVKVESERGQGSTFRVFLPIEGPKAGEEEIDVEESVGRR